MKLMMAVIHGNGHGLVPGLDDTSEAGGMSRMSHAMYHDTREDLKHVESELEKDKETQEKWKMNKMVMMKNIMVFE